MRPGWALGSVLTAAVLAACGPAGPSEGAPSAPSPSSPSSIGGLHVECVGVPDVVCSDAVAGVGPTERGVPPVAVRVACAAPSCTGAGGRVLVEVRYADGSGSESGFGWGAAPPVPAMPFEPACVGVPVDRCREFARNAYDDDPNRATVVSVAVRCHGTCTPTDGEGVTVLTRRDGSTLEIDFLYEAAGGH